MYFLRAKPEHAAMLSRIAFASKRYWGYPDAWMESWREVLTVRPAFIKNHEVYTASRESDVLGFYALVRREECLSLEHFWVLPEVMNRGVGRSMFEHALKRARVMGFQSLEIESDPNAEGFYRRMGARRVRTRTMEVEGEHRELPVMVCGTAAL
jgi:GNAT superfamily N-acetyltransferase